MEKEPQPKFPQPMPPPPMVPPRQLMHSTGNSQAQPTPVDLMPHTEGTGQNPVSSMVEPTTMPPNTAQPRSILQPPSTASTHELDAPESPSTQQPAPEAKGSDRSNWCIPEGEPNSRPRRQTTNAWFMTPKQDCTGNLSVKHNLNRLLSKLRS